MLVLTHRPQGSLSFLLSYLPAGAAHVGRRADPCCCWTEEPWGVATKAGTGAGRTWDWHPGEGAQHHHPPAVSGEASGEETHGEVQEESAQVKRWQSYQPAFRLVTCWAVSGEMGGTGEPVAFVATFYWYLCFSIGCTLGKTCLFGIKKLNLMLLWLAFPKVPSMKARSKFEMLHVC